MLNHIIITHLLLIISLYLTAILGDQLVKFTYIPLHKAVLDNLTHGIIGGLTWWIICIADRPIYMQQLMSEIILSTCIASFIDLDHFYAAGSAKLMDAINLKERPILHCSTYPVLFSIVLIIFAYFLQNNVILRLTLLIFAAFFSHHTRDATRRGYWFYPFGSTPPLPYVFYIFLIILLPYSIILFMYCKPIEGSVDKLLPRVIGV